MTIQFLVFDLFLVLFLFWQIRQAVRSRAFKDLFLRGLLTFATASVLAALKFYLLNEVYQEDFPQEIYHFEFWPTILISSFLMPALSLLIIHRQKIQNIFFRRSVLVVAAFLLFGLVIYHVKGRELHGRSGCTLKLCFNESGEKECCNSCWVEAWSLDKETGAVFPFSRTPSCQHMDCEKQCKKSLKAFGIPVAGYFIVLTSGWRDRLESGK